MISSRTFSRPEFNSVIFIQYEDLINDTTTTLKRVCSHLNIEFNNNLLDIPIIGSSNFSDTVSHSGIDSSKTEKWKHGGLNNTEIQICQNISAEYMRLYNYSLVNVKSNKFYQLLYVLILPFQLFISVMFNFKRLKNPVAILKKILGIQ